MRHELHDSFIHLAFNGILNSPCWASLYSHVLPRGLHCLLLLSIHCSLCVLSLSLWMQTQEFLPSCLAWRSLLKTQSRSQTKPSVAVLMGRVLPDKMPICCLALGDLSTCVMFRWSQAAFCSLMDRYGWLHQRFSRALNHNLYL